MGLIETRIGRAAEAALAAGMSFLSLAGRRPVATCAVAQFQFWHTIPRRTMVVQRSGRDCAMVKTIEGLKGVREPE